MSRGKHLYFLALMPPEPLAKKVHEFKTEIAGKYGSTYSLPVPEHITIIAPFFCFENHEEEICSKLENFAKTFSQFSISLKDFGHFKDHTIYIHPVDQPENSTRQLFEAVFDFMQNEFLFLPKMKRYSSFNPHMTIAYRDLQPVF